MIENLHLQWDLKWHMTLMWENVAGYQSWFQFIKLSVMPLIHYIFNSDSLPFWLKGGADFFFSKLFVYERADSLWYIADMFTENWNSENHSLLRFTVTGSRNKNNLDNSYDLMQLIDSKFLKTLSPVSDWSFFLVMLTDRKNCSLNRRILYCGVNLKQSSSCRQKS